MARGIGVGRAIITDPDAARPFESDTIMCAHCQRVIMTNTLDEHGRKRDHGGGKFDLGGNCRLCRKMVCGPCADNGVCDPFEEKLLRMESRGRLLDEVEKNHDPIERLWSEHDRAESSR